MFRFLLLLLRTQPPNPTGIVCGEPDTNNCQTPSCTFTHGFFANHPEVVTTLLAAAGGSITLGSGTQGLSLTVTTVPDAITVLQGNAPSPPTPSSPPLKGQYQILYAQLLAADLNVLNGATCPFATAAIGDANAFLATSPVPNGTTGAPAFTARLDEFNSGDAPGCPLHCADNDNVEA